MCCDHPTCDCTSQISTFIALTLEFCLHLCLIVCCSCVGMHANSWVTSCSSQHILLQVFLQCVEDWSRCAHILWLFLYWELNKMRFYYSILWSALALLPRCEWKTTTAWMFFFSWLPPYCLFFWCTDFCIKWCSLTGAKPESFSGEGGHRHQFSSRRVYQR